MSKSRILIMSVMKSQIRCYLDRLLSPVYHLQTHKYAFNIKHRRFLLLFSDLLWTKCYLTLPRILWYSSLSTFVSKRPYLKTRTFTVSENIQTLSGFQHIIRPALCGLVMPMVSRQEPIYMVIIPYISSIERPAPTAYSYWTQMEWILRLMTLRVRVIRHLNIT